MNLTRFFFKKSTEGILSVFNKTIADLESHIETQNADAGKKRSKAQDLMAKALAAEVEANKARLAANQIKNIFGS